MRIAQALKIAAAAFALLVTGGPGVVAQQGDDIMRFLRWDRERMRQLQKPGPAIIRVPRAEPRLAVRRPRPKAEPTVVVRDTPDAPKIAPTAFVAMLGDSLGELVGQGLAAELATQPHIVVLKKAKGSSGLVRDDFHDWPKAVTELLAGSDAVTVGVMLIGSNDRQPIRENGQAHEPGSERWRELYQERVRAVVAAFAQKRVPLVWVGLPPMQNARYGADMLSLNEIFRAEVQKGGGHWVELWEAFVDGQGRFTSHGPDLAGQPARLRTADGIHFTKAGAQKAAHFVDVALKRLIEQPTGAPVIAVPTDPSAPADTAAAPPAITFPEQPELAAAPVLPVRPLAGPIQSLAQPDAAPGAQLAAAPPARRSVDPFATRVFVEGRPMDAKAGRADDFRWPGK